MRQLDRDGRTVAWIEVGHGPERALVLHPGLSRARAMRPLMAALGDRLSMAAPDLPDHGGTDGTGGQDAQHVAMADAEAVIAATGGGPVHLIGHSFGATVALHLAVRRPGLVRSLALYEPVYFVLLHDAGSPAYDAHLAEMAPFARAWQAGDRDAATEAFLRIWGDGAFERMGPDTLRYARDRIHTIVESEAAILRPDTPGRLHLAELSRLAAPLLVMHGATSPPVVRDIAATIAAAVPRCRAEEIADAGHMAPIVHPVEVAGHIGAFLDMLVP